MKNENGKKISQTFLESCSAKSTTLGFMFSLTISLTIDFRIFNINQMKSIYTEIINFVIQRDRKNFLHLNTFKYYRYF